MFSNFFVLNTRRVKKTRERTVRFSNQSTEAKTQTYSLGQKYKQDCSYQG